MATRDTPSDGVPPASEDRTAEDGSAAPVATIGRQPAAPPDGESEGERRLTLIEHLEELRTRLVRAIIAIAVCTAIAFFFTRQLLELLALPLGEFRANLISTEMTEFFGAYMRVALTAGIIGAMPIVVYQIVAFVTPGLTRQERRILFTWLPFVTVSFAIGVVFGFLVVLPPAVRFLLLFGADTVNVMVRISNYVSFVTTLLLWIGVIFELPVILALLTRLGVVNYRRLASWRRYAILLAFVVAAIVTPTPDPVNQTIVALPMIVLYELGVQIARWM
jgi:sec-independent protein translocase protein TatC